jgi:hypothetical protein
MSYKRYSKPCSNCKKIFGKCYVAFEFDNKGRCEACSSYSKLLPKSSKEIQNHPKEIQDYPDEMGNDSCYIVPIT